MTKTTKEKLAILDDTIKAFNSKTLCTDGGNCRYYMDGKSGCAIGRLIDDKELCKRLDLSSDAGVSNPDVFAQLPIDIQGYGMEFLQRLQSLHDTRRYWDETGLSTQGLEEAASIRFAVNQGWL